MNKHLQHVSDDEAIKKQSFDTVLQSYANNIHKSAAPTNTLHDATMQQQALKMMSSSSSRTHTAGDRDLISSALLAEELLSKDGRPNIRPASSSSSRPSSATGSSTKTARFLNQSKGNNNNHDPNDANLLVPAGSDSGNSLGPRRHTFSGVEAIKVTAEDGLGLQTSATGGSGDAAAFEILELKNEIRLLQLQATQTTNVIDNMMMVFEGNIG